MNPTGPNPYLKTRIMTASPEELRLMLYDGAIKFCRQARTALEKKDIEAGYQNLMRAQKIVLELSTSLNHNLAPDLCAKLSALYTYIYRLLVDANMSHQVGPVDEALELLGYEKETWQLLIRRLEQDAARKPTAELVDVTGARQTAISSL